MPSMTNIQIDPKTATLVSMQGFLIASLGLMRKSDARP